MSLLTALLDVAADEFLGVLLEHLVDLVQNGVDVVRELVLPLLDLLAGAVWVSSTSSSRRVVCF